MVLWGAIKQEVKGLIIKLIWETKILLFFIKSVKHYFFSMKYIFFNSDTYAEEYLLDVNGFFFDEMHVSLTFYRDFNGWPNLWNS